MGKVNQQKNNKTTGKSIINGQSESTKKIIKQLAKQLSMGEVNQQKNNKTTGKAIINGKSESAKK
jgi:hypothetical protein